MSATRRRRSRRTAAGCASPPICRPSPPGSPRCTAREVADLDRQLGELRDRPRRGCGRHAHARARLRDSGGRLPAGAARGRVGRGGGRGACRLARSRRRRDRGDGAGARASPRHRCWRGSVPPSALGISRSAPRSARSCCAAIRGPRRPSRRMRAAGSWPTCRPSRAAGSRGSASSGSTAAANAPYRRPDKYFSHRRDGRTGRQATLIWLERDA